MTYRESPLKFFLEFTTDITHVQGLNNVVSDALSRITLAGVSLSFELDYDAFAEAQGTDPEPWRVQRIGCVLTRRRTANNLRYF